MIAETIRPMRNEALKPDCVSMYVRPAWTTMLTTMNSSAGPAAFHMTRSAFSSADTRKVAAVEV